MNKILDNLQKNWITYGFETVVVVVGILGAYALNNWNTARIDKEKEQVILIQLKSEFESNLDQLESKMQMRNQIIRNGQKILNALDEDIKPPEDSLFLWIAKSYYVPTFDPIVNNISASGDLNLISNNQLKRILAVWTSELVQVTEEEEIWKRFWHDYYLPLVIKHLNYRKLMNLSEKQNHARSYLLSGKPYLLEMGYRDHDIDTWKVLKSVQDFEDYIARGVRTSYITNIQSDFVRGRIQEILELIDEEIDK